jgi:hypothetical protein
MLCSFEIYQSPSSQTATSTMNNTVSFLGPNFEDYEINFYVTALRHGKVGLDFIRSRWNQSKSDKNLSCKDTWRKDLSNKETERTDTFPSISSSVKSPCEIFPLGTNPDALVGESNMSDRQNLFADMMFSISPVVYKRLKERKFLRSLIINVDHIG